MLYNPFHFSVLFPSFPVAPFERITSTTVGELNCQSTYLCTNPTRIIFCRFVVTLPSIWFYSVPIILLWIAYPFAIKSNAFPERSSKHFKCHRETYRKRFLWTVISVRNICQWIGYQNLTGFSDLSRLGSSNLLVTLRPSLSPFPLPSFPPLSVTVSFKLQDRSRHNYGFAMNPVSLSILGNDADTSIYA